jgi:hypothetical protein
LLKKVVGCGHEFACRLEIGEVAGGNFPIGAAGNAVGQFARRRDDLVVGAPDHEGGTRELSGLCAYVDLEIELDLTGYSVPIGDRHVTIDHGLNRHATSTGEECRCQAREYEQSRERVSVVADEVEP